MITVSDIFEMVYKSNIDMYNTIIGSNYLSNVVRPVHYFYNQFRYHTTNLDEYMVLHLSTALVQRDILKIIHTKITLSFSLYWLNRVLNI